MPKKAVLSTFKNRKFKQQGTIGSLLNFRKTSIRLPMGGSYQTSSLLERLIDPLPARRFLYLVMVSKIKGSLGSLGLYRGLVNSE